VSKSGAVLRLVAKPMMTRNLILLAALSFAPAFGTPLTLTSQELYVYVEADPALYLSNASPEFFTTLNADNLGSYGWQIVNSGVNPWTAVTLLFFLDAEWDLTENLVTNEYAEFFGLSVPDGAPPGAIAPGSWEADEPGYVFGDIYANVSFNGFLDNSNAVPSSAPDDVSIAFGWTALNVAPGETLTLTMQHLTSATTGIGHFDPDSLAGFYVNGYLERSGAPADPDPDPDPTAVPEPSTAWMLAAGVALSAATCRNKFRS